MKTQRKRVSQPSRAAARSSAQSANRPQASAQRSEIRSILGVPSGGLRMGRTQDAHERQANRVADRVTRSAPSHGPQAVEHSGSQPLPASRVQGGSPLPESSRRFFEGQLGQDLSGVRLHRGARAAESAHALSAEAYTVGSDIVLGEGFGDPGTAAGRHLLAHELTHVVQQAEIGPVIQRKPLRKYKNRGLATLVGRDGGTTDAVANVVSIDEVVPVGERPGRFIGFEQELHAMVIARQQSTVSAIVQDSEGRYHVLDTGRSGIPSGFGTRRKPREEPRDFRLVRWVEPMARAGRSREVEKSWQERVIKAHELIRSHETRARGYQMFVDLLIDATGVDPSEVHLALTEAQLEPGKINFYPGVPSKGATYPGDLPTERGAEMPEPTIAVGPGAFKRDSPVFTQMTTVHELKHLSHLQRSVALIQAWHASGSSRDFSDWLFQKTKRRRGGISQEDRATTLNATGPGVDVLEIFGYMEGLMAGYHLFTSQDQMTRALLNLDSMAERWNSLPHKALEVQVTAQLLRYYCALDASHRSAFDSFVDEQRSRASDQGRINFYREMAKFPAECRRSRR